MKTSIMILVASMAISGCAIQPVSKATHADRECRIEASMYTPAMFNEHNPEYVKCMYRRGVASKPGDVDQHDLSVGR